MSQSKELTAVILCGGLGTRLRTVTNDEVPKPMVEIDGRPFIEYVLDNLHRQGVNSAVLAVSHKKEIIMNHFGSLYKGMKIQYSVEAEPLGTGGAISKAIAEIESPEHSPVLVVNGDTFVDFELDTMLDNLGDNILSMVVKEMSDTSRYGRVELTSSNHVSSFSEKKAGHSGYINAGVYLINPRYYSELPSEESYSFESAFLHPKSELHKFYAHIVNDRFIDIGIPEDYYRCSELLN